MTAYGVISVTSVPYARACSYILQHPHRSVGKCNTFYHVFSVCPHICFLNRYPIILSVCYDKVGFFRPHFYHLRAYSLAEYYSVLSALPFIPAVIYRIVSVSRVKYVCVVSRSSPQAVVSGSPAEYVITFVPIQRIASVFSVKGVVSIISVNFVISCPTKYYFVCSRCHVCVISICNDI